MTLYRQLPLFTFTPTAKATPPKASSVRNPDAPPRESNWLASFIAPHQLPPLTPPAIVHRPRRKSA